MGSSGIPYYACGRSRRGAAGAAWIVLCDTKRRTPCRGSRPCGCAGCTFAICGSNWNPHDNAVTSRGDAVARSGMGAEEVQGHDQTAWASDGKSYLARRRQFAFKFMLLVLVPDKQEPIDEISRQVHETCKMNFRSTNLCGIERCPQKEGACARCTQKGRKLWHIDRRTSARAPLLISDCRVQVQHRPKKLSEYGSGTRKRDPGSRVDRVQDLENEATR